MLKEENPQIQSLKMKLFHHHQQHLSWRLMQWMKWKWIEVKNKSYKRVLSLCSLYASDLRVKRNKEKKAHKQSERKIKIVFLSLPNNWNKIAWKSVFVCASL